jgi:hypothetical protein
VLHVQLWNVWQSVEKRSPVEKWQIFAASVFLPQVSDKMMHYR